MIGMIEAIAPTDKILPAYNAKSRDLLGMGVQGAKPPAGARGVPAISPFPKR